jgi:histone deacetylase HOS3
MSVRTQAPPVLNVKRTRPAAPSRKDSGKAPRAPRRAKPAVAKVTGPSTTSTQPSSSAGKGDSLPLPNSQPSLATADSSATRIPTRKDDLAQITNGMKKIKINVLSKEQKEARLRAKAEMAAAGDIATPTAESPLVDQLISPSAIVEAQPNSAHYSIGHLQEPVETGGVETDSQYSSLTPPTNLEAGPAIPKTPTILIPTEPSPSSTPFASSPLVQITLDPTQDMDLFVPYQPDGPPPNPIPIQRPVQILEPNTGTPARSRHMQPPGLQSYSVPVSPVRRGHGFTATSNIPFSPSPARTLSKDTTPALAQPVINSEDVDSSKWAILGTPEQ